MSKLRWWRKSGDRNFIEDVLVISFSDQWVRVLFVVFISSTASANETSDYVAAKELAGRSNIVFGEGYKQPTGKKELSFVAEIWQGSSLKYELRTATGSLILDRVNCPREFLHQKKSVKLTGYPLNYGIAPGLFNVDGDPLDVVVIGDPQRYQAMIQSHKLRPVGVRVIGLVKMEECENVPCKNDQEWQNDWKVLAVDGSFDKKIQSISDVPKVELEKIDLFFSNYKGSKRGFSQTRVAGFSGEADAVKFLEGFSDVSSDARAREIASCRSHNQKLLNNREKYLSLNKVDTKFLKCINRVLDPEFFASRQSKQFFVKYSLEQLLRGKLGVTGEIKDPVAKMIKRRAKGKTYYRFVKVDKLQENSLLGQQVLGSGDMIFEWVKTKNRGNGCAKDFPKQHYEHMPMIDLSYE